MSIRTESYTVDLNDDGTSTVTEVYTITPPTRNQQIAAWTALGLTVASPFIMVGLAVAWDKHLEKKEARKAAKLEKKSK